MESLKCEVIDLYWLSAYPSCVRWCLLCIASVRGCIRLREELCTPGCIAPNPQCRFPVWESCVDKLVEILLCEGGDVELCARTSKHISVFAFDPLTLTLSLSLLCVLIHIAISYTCLCVCVPHLCLTTRASKVPQLLFRGIKRS